MPEKKLFIITRTVTEVAEKVAYHKETIEDLLEHAPGALAWQARPTLTEIEIKEVPIKKWP